METAMEINERDHRSNIELEQIGFLLEARGARIRDADKSLKVSA
jgi:hypothetical protein